MASNDHRDTASLFVDARLIEHFQDRLRSAYGLLPKDMPNQERLAVFNQILLAMRKEIYQPGKHLGLYKSVQRESMLEIAFKTIEAEIKGYFPESLNRQEGASLGLEQLAAIATPEPYVNSEGILDTKLNESFDLQGSEEGIQKLRLRLSKVTSTAIGHFPGNAPPLLRTGLELYSEALSKGEQEYFSVGHLSDAMALIEPCVEEARKEQIFDAGMDALLQRIIKLHNDLLEMFPLDAVRDEVISRLDQSYIEKASPKLNISMTALTRAAVEAHIGGMATDEFIKALQYLERNAEISAKIPASDDGKSKKFVRRVVANTLGFLERIISTTSASLAILSNPKFQDFVKYVKNALSHLIG